jgi:tetratricopeptide (TPR) repeat protein
MTREEFEQAELLYREAVSYAQEWSTPPNVILLHNNLASVLDQQGKVAETEEVLLEAIRIAEDHWPEGHWRVGSSYGALGDFLMTVGDTATAEPFQRDRMESYIQTLGPDHAWTAFAKAVEGTCLTSAGRYPEAESLLLQAYAALRSSSGEDNSYTLDAVRRLVTLYESWGRLDQAERYRALLPRTEDGT